MRIHIFVVQQPSYWGAEENKPNHYTLGGDYWTPLGRQDEDTSGKHSLSKNCEANEGWITEGYNDRE